MVAEFFFFFEHNAKKKNVGHNFAKDKVISKCKNDNFQMIT